MKFCNFLANLALIKKKTYLEFHRLESVFRYVWSVAKFPRDHVGLLLKKNFVHETYNKNILLLFWRILNN